MTSAGLGPAAARPPRSAPWRGLVQACHPLPCLAVTAFGAGYGAVIGLRGTTLALLAAAVLTGQFVVGWTNDWLDGDRDRAAGRTDKPIATGAVSRRAVGWAGLVAGCACVPLSLALGALPGAIHLTAVAGALGYDLGLKAGPWSPLPYLVSFGLLPCVATTALDGQLPPVAVIVGSGLLGVAAHFANTVPDATADAVTGVRGLPQRIGPVASLRVTAVGVATAAVVLVIGAAHRRPVAMALLTAGAAVALAGVRLSSASGAHRAFRVTLLSVALVVAGFLAAG